MKNRISKGQAFLNFDSEICYGNVNPITDYIIDEISDIHNGSHRRYENPFIMDSIKRSVTNKLCISDSYNAKLYSYPTGQHVVIYDKTVTRREVGENFTRAYQNEDRTNEQREHCIAVSMALTKKNIYKIPQSFPPS